MAAKTPVYRVNGDLRDIVVFDLETYLINENLAIPRGVCGSIVSNAWPEHLLRFANKEGLLIEKGDDFHVALLPMEPLVIAMSDFLSRAWTSRCDGEGALLIGGHNVSYDLAGLLQRARLMELKGEALDGWERVAETVGIPSEHATYELTLHKMILDLLDVEGTGLPGPFGSTSNIIDTQIREALLLNASGKTPNVGTSLAACVKKYLDVDRSEEKKGPPCPTCNATGKVEETYRSCRKKVCSVHNVPTEDERCPDGHKTQVRTFKSKCPECQGAKLLTPWRLRFAELDGVPLEEWPAAAVDYVLDDALDPLQVLARQAGTFGLEDVDPEGEYVIVDALGAVTDEAAQVRAAWALGLARMNGPRSERAMFERYRTYTEERSKAAREIGRRLGFVRENGTRNVKVHQALVEAAYARLGREAPRTPTGAVKTDAQTIQDSRDGDLILYQEFKDKDYTKVIEEGLDHALVSDPGVLKATGRVSWKKYMHQPPRKGLFRECWKARPGKVYISCDWTAAEMVALAEIQYLLFGTSAMRAAINAGQGLHKVLAAQLWNLDPRNLGKEEIDYAEFCRLYEALDAMAKELRQFSKVGNFGFPGGLTERTFVDYARGYGLALTEEQGRLIREAWMRAWPEMADYLEFFRRADANSGGFGFTYQQWVSGRLRGGTTYTDGCNQGFQGMIADAIKLVMWWTTRESFTPCWGGSRELVVAYPHTPGDPWKSRDVTIEVPCSDAGTSPLYGSRAWLWIHDEGLLEAPEEKAADAAERLSWLMCKALSYFAPDVDTAAPPALMRRWYKGAEPVYVEGQLVPWEPEESP